MHLLLWTQKLVNKGQYSVLQLMVMVMEPNLSYGEMTKYTNLWFSRNKQKKIACFLLFYLISCLLL